MTAVEPKPELSHEETVDPKVEVHNLDSDDLAHLANQEAHDETVLVALKKHPWTVAWCVYGIWILLLCAFDNTTGGSVVSIPWFRHDYGYAFEGDYVLPANWQSAYSGGPAAASVIGTVFSGCKWHRHRLHLADPKTPPTSWAASGRCSSATCS